MGPSSLTITFRQNGQDIFSAKVDAGDCFYHPAMEEIVCDAFNKMSKQVTPPPAFDSVIATGQHSRQETITDNTEVAALAAKISEIKNDPKFRIGLKYFTLTGDQAFKRLKWENR